MSNVNAVGGSRIPAQNPRKMSRSLFRKKSFWAGVSTVIGPVVAASAVILAASRPVLRAELHGNLVMDQNEGYLFPGREKVTIFVGFRVLDAEPYTTYPSCYDCKTMIGKVGHVAKVRVDDTLYNELLKYGPDQTIGLQVRSSAVHLVGPVSINIGGSGLIAEKIVPVVSDVRSEMFPVPRGR